MYLKVILVKSYRILKENPVKLTPILFNINLEEPLASSNDWVKFLGFLQGQIFWHRLYLLIKSTQRFWRLHMKKTNQLK